MKAFAIATLAVIGVGVAKAQSPADSAGRNGPERITWAQVGSPVFPAMPAMERRRLVDSLAAGRARWNARRPTSYRIHTVVGCFCGPSNDSTAAKPVLVVRNNSVVGHAPSPQRGADNLGNTLSLTVDQLFATLERDLRDEHRSVEGLRLDSRYGFPRAWRSAAPGISDSDAGYRVVYFQPMSDR